MDRRTFLAAAATVAAGCSTSTGSGDSDSTPTRESGPPVLSSGDWWRPFDGATYRYRVDGVRVYHREDVTFDPDYADGDTSFAPDEQAVAVLVTIENLDDDEASFYGSHLRWHVLADGQAYSHDETLDGPEWCGQYGNYCEEIHWSQIRLPLESRYSRLPDEVPGHYKGTHYFPTATARVPAADLVVARERLDEDGWDVKWRPES